VTSALLVIRQESVNENSVVAITHFWTYIFVQLKILSHLATTDAHSTGWRLSMSDDTGAATGAQKQGLDLPPRWYSDAVIAYAILRISFGLNFMLHGVSRLLADHANFVAYVNHYFEHTPLMPRTALVAFAAALPPVEATLGLLLVVGFATRFVLVAGGLTMTALVFGTNLAQDWNNAGLQLIYCFMFYYLLAHRCALNMLSFDTLRRHS
jgi:thiosulfate dehydrogenase (quinone) large subunit